MNEKYQFTKFACYANNISMSVVANLSPLLFLTFREQYGLSYSLLGLLVLVNYFTQLSIDLVFSFFSHRFNIAKVVRITPLITLIGLVVYAVPSMFFPQAAYAFIIVGTVIFSSAAGLSEVLTSPVIAAIPAENPDREMSKLHSVYAWGVVFVVIISTVFLTIFGSQNWQYLALMWTVIPLTALILFSRAAIPPLATPERAAKAAGIFRDKRMILCVATIFLGGAAECTMSQWSSGYIESALGLPKVYGDVFGVAMFALMMGIGRTLYAKCGKRIYPILFGGFVGAIACYVVAALSGSAIVGLIACALTGFCTSMLWPGSLIMMEDILPSVGVAAYALMAAGGDMGASLGPQIVGIIADAAAQNSALVSLAESLALAPDQLGMRIGMLVAALFAVIGVALITVMWKCFAPKREK
ncbi:MAG: MFS transporter [Clostridia bacterium]|nr:MFS transporter [Clostridia bacterium]